MSRIFLEGGGREAQVFHLSEVLGSLTGILKGLKKIRNSGGEERFMILEFRGHGGGIFDILEYPKQGGLKCYATCGRVWIFSEVTHSDLNYCHQHKQMLFVFQ